MHRLNRGQTPLCLSKYQHGRNNWRDLTDQDREEIWQALEAMQGSRCAYCEAGITQYRRHIEHFVKKGRNPRVTFQWENLFGSCNREDSCGKYKDHSASPYSDADLLKPDVDDPDDFLIFVHDGTIQPRQNLDAVQQRRAEETLRVFNLDAEHGALRQMRKAATSGYLQTAETLWALAEEFDDDEWQQLLDAELAAIADLPFVTAIRHTLCQMS
jgi:uncharacterized protein (TIGR02646 family)